MDLWAILITFTAHIYNLYTNMWQRLASILLKYRFVLLSMLLVVTVILGFEASKVQLSYDFVKAIPTNNPKYQEYLKFKKTFGEDGNMLFIGVRTDSFYQKDFYNGYSQLVENIRHASSVTDVLSIPTAPDLVKDPVSERLKAVILFPAHVESQKELDSLRDLFQSLPFYRGLLYNPQTRSYLFAVHIDKDVLNSAKRVGVIQRIQNLVRDFGTRYHVTMHMSGLPIIRTEVSTKISHELKVFLLISFLLTAVILFAFFRSIGAVLLSMVVVMTGVIWSLATIVLLGYKITLLTGLIPPLIVVIGIPNCVYFLNKYHSEYNLLGNKPKAIVRMVQRMGIVTLFTNLTAAIGFGVFFFTRSAILKEFGMVAGLNIMFIFMISFIFLPAILSYLPPPKGKHTSYLDSAILRKVLLMLEHFVFEYRKLVYLIAGLVLVVSIIGMSRLRAVGYIVDDLPHSDILYRDLKFFESNFNGVMPLEVLVDTKHKYGIFSLETLSKMDALCQEIARNKDFAPPLSLVQGLKFARQAYYLGDSSSYALPNQFDMAFLAPYLRLGSDSSSKASSFSRLLTSFMDPDKRVARISVNMADIGTVRLAIVLDSLKREAARIFSPSKYNVVFTGSSIIFLEGSRYIINGLIESLILSFLLILGCMLYLFRSFRMLLISLLPNIIPLVVTAGVMGWVGVPLKPSTVLVFSIALGIAIDVTIRFLVNFKQELPLHNYDISETVKGTIQDTGLSILFTGMILFAGFMIFSFSQFGGTKALGWLTSLTLVLAMIANLTLLPALLLWMESTIKKKARSKEPIWSTLDEEEDIDLDKLGLDKLDQDGTSHPE